MPVLLEDELESREWVIHINPSSALTQNRKSAIIVNSFNKCLLNAYCVPGTVLDAENIVGNISILSEHIR